jgi:hypothetical protein
MEDGSIRPPSSVFCQMRIHYAICSYKQLLLQGRLDPFKVSRNLFNPQPYYHICLKLAKYRHRAFLYNTGVATADIEPAFIVPCADRHF